MKRKTVKLKDYNNSISDLQKFQEDIEQILLPNIFDFTAMEQLVFTVLKTITPINRSVKNTTKSIHSSIEKILNHFSKEDNINNSPNIKAEFYNSSLEKDNYKLFQQYIVGFESLPLLEYRKLRNEVETHLMKINELIKKYEIHPIVKQFWKDKKHTGNHESQKVLDFYERCINERQNILNFYLEGTAQKAIQKARFNSDNNLYSDFPYQSGQVDFFMMGKSLDFENINCVAHRVSHVLLKDYFKYYTLYSQDKEKFYKKLFKEKTLTSIFNNILENLELVPISNDRFPIFKELKRLFLKKKWLAFYALALPQVEGLFSEMTIASSIKKNLSSLPKKVKEVRSKYFLSDVYFDYYQYYLPDQRNQFSHTGFDENFRLKSFDLLTDLDHILSVFSNMDVPIVKLHKKIKSRNPSDFKDFRNFVRFYQNIKELSKEKTREAKPKINHFINDFILKEISLLEVFKNANSELNQRIINIQNDISNHIKDKELISKFDSLNRSTLNKIFKQNNTSLIQIISLFNNHRKDFQDIIHLNYFFFKSEDFLLNEENSQRFLPEFNLWKSSKLLIKSIEEIKYVLLGDYKPLTNTSFRLISDNLSIGDVMAFSEYPK